MDSYFDDWAERNLRSFFMLKIDIVGLFGEAC